MNSILAEIYDLFHTPSRNVALEQRVEDNRKRLIEVLGKPERRLLLEIIDAKDQMAETASIDSFPLVSNWHADCATNWPTSKTASQASDLGGVRAARTKPVPVQGSKTREKGPVSTGHRYPLTGGRKETILRLCQKHTGIRESCSCEVGLSPMVLTIPEKRNSRDGSQCPKH